MTRPRGLPFPLAILLLTIPSVSEAVSIPLPEPIWQVGDYSLSALIELPEPFVSIEEITISISGTVDGLLGTASAS